MASKNRALVLIFSIGVCLIPWSAKAGGDPAVVRPPVENHRFFDAPNILVQAANIALMAADVATTREALKIPGTRELNPLARSSAGLISLKIGAVGAGMGIAYLMHRSGHHKAERIFPLFLGLPSGLAAIHNSRVH